MALQVEEGKGVLFVNEYKKHPKAPTHHGAINIDGVQHKIAGWLRNTDRGQIMSIAIDNFRPGFPQEKRDDDAVPF